MPLQMKSCHEKVPDTGVVREYWFNVENTTAALDGIRMPVQLINGSSPGRKIIADWGDTDGKNLQMFQFHSYRSETDEWKKLCMSRTRY
jgi:hypothetical protein